MTSTKRSILTSTQKGAIGEGVVAARLILDSHGRLAPYSPMADDRGVDLLIFDQQTGQAVPLQIKSRMGLVKGKKHCRFGVRAATLEPHAMLLAVLLDINNTNITIQTSWLIPLRDIKSLKNVNSKGVYAIQPNPCSTSQDKYSDYRCHNFLEVSQRIIAWCEQKK